MCRKNIRVWKGTWTATGGMGGCQIAGYGNAEVDSPFEGYAGPPTETVLMGNLFALFQHP
jgi:hypothetical protein